MKLTSNIPSFKNYYGAAFAVLVAILVSAKVQNLDNVSYLSYWLGISFGVVLQRSRFCFYCISRDFIEKKNSIGLLGIITALAVGTLGYHIIFGAFLIEPLFPQLPPNAHISPVSIILILGSLSFGFGMALAGSCISAQLYRLGEGLISSIFAFIGIIFGFILAFKLWNYFYLKIIIDAPVIWFPHYFGYTGSVIFQLFILLCLALILLKFHKKQKREAVKSWWKVKWPTYVGGILIGLIGMIAFLRITPLGVTAEFGNFSRNLGDYLNVTPIRLEGFDTLRGCLGLVKNIFWTNNGLFILGLVLGSLASAIFSEDFKVQIPKTNEIRNSFVGGLFMGFGSMIALGCTVGSLLSGIMAASLSGWVFFVFCGGGLYLGWLTRNKYNF
jgi:uncharacterized membrane protein YedE/YeeE